jgi:hypothetical protein
MFSAIRHGNDATAWSECLRRLVIDNDHAAFVPRGMHGVSPGPSTIPRHHLVAWFPAVQW